MSPTLLVTLDISSLFEKKKLSSNLVSAFSSQIWNLGASNDRLHSYSQTHSHSLCIKCSESSADMFIFQSEKAGNAAEGCKWWPGEGRDVGSRGQQRCSLRQFHVTPECKQHPGSTWQAGLQTHPSRGSGVLEWGDTKDKQGGMVRAGHAACEPALWSEELKPAWGLTWVLLHLFTKQYLYLSLP